MENKQLQMLKKLSFSYLSKYNCSCEKLKSHLRKKLKKIFYNELLQDSSFIDEYLNQLDDVILYLQQLGYLNDDIYAKYQFNSLLNRGKSMVQISYKFQEKGLNPSIISNIIQDGHQNIDVELFSACKFLKKKSLGIYRKKIEFDINKEIAIMYRNGFNYDIIKKVLKMSVDEIESILQL